MNQFDQFAKVELKYKPSALLPSYKVSCSEGVYKRAMAIFDDDTISYYEEFKILFLNRANYISGYFEVSKGGISGTVVDVRLIFQAALLHNASSIILIQYGM